MVDEKRAAPLMVVAAALIRGDRVLVQQRPAGKAMAGLWEFPGGKLEPGETAEAALIRELAEELGIAVEPDVPQPITFATGQVAGRTLVLLLFRVDRWTGEPRALEAPALCWADLQRLRALPMPPADEPLIEALAGLLSAS